MGVRLREESIVAEPLTKTAPQLPPIDREAISDPELVEVLERSERSSSRRNRPGS